MSRTEKIKNNIQVQNAVSKISYTMLHKDVKKELQQLINGCTFLGKNRVEAKEIYNIIQKCNEISEVQVFHYLEHYRVTKNQQIPKSKSTKEKYKRIATMVSELFEQMIEDGKPLNDLIKYRKKQQVLTSEQTQEHIDLVNSGVDLQALIDHLVSLKK